MRVGYARTSTIDQVAGLEAQLRDLKAAGCEKIFSEQLSSVDAKRLELERALEFVREGDIFVVTKIDRLARSIINLVEIEARLAAKGVGLSILSPGMDTSTPAGRLTFSIFGAVAQFEREIMLERQREGIRKAKEAGKYKGRTPTAKFHSAAVLASLAIGEPIAMVAKRYNMTERSVYRIKAADKLAKSTT